MNDEMKLVCACALQVQLNRPLANLEPKAYPRSAGLGGFCCYSIGPALSQIKLESNLGIQLLPKDHRSYLRSLEDLGYLFEGTTSHLPSVVQVLLRTG
jgi:hypothetical protein